MYVNGLKKRHGMQSAARSRKHGSQSNDSAKLCSCVSY